MTLCLSVVTEEGVVLAADSLGTLLRMDQKALHGKCQCGREGVFHMICPQCGQNLGEIPAMVQQIPTTHTYHCQKLFQLSKYVGLSVAGNPQIGENKFQHWVVSFKASINDENAKQEKIVDLLEKRFASEEIEKKATDVTEILVAGITENVREAPRSSVFYISPGQIKKGPTFQYGISVIGTHDVLDKMFAGGGIQEYPVQLFPLQDAVEFAHFLMQTQIGVDRYSNRIPRVGGEIDLAVIHPYYGFKWVKQKKLEELFQ